MVPVMLPVSAFRYRFAASTSSSRMDPVSASMRISPEQTTSVTRTLPVSASSSTVSGVMFAMAIRPVSALIFSFFTSAPSTVTAPVSASTSTAWKDTPATSFTAPVSAATLSDS